ncbi:unnamed protein product [Effrenium voratum]|uniref:Dipeptidyl peptidase 1 n=1 Tax=Effrenium voratum TaxID=2562239 RepID=A0AA36J1N7_9DINO|nr:unnamed protein product [Effrenium voratum]
MSWLFWALQLLTCQIAFADLPVHCLHHEIIGSWKFVLGRPSGTRSSCGHLRPDSVDVQPGRDVLDAVDRELVVSLKDPNIAEAEAHPLGTWTMIYDEGFEVELGHLNFFAFSNFTFDVNEHGKHNISHCDQTMVGWYHNKDRTQFGCYYGTKIPTEEEMQLAVEMKSRHLCPSRKKPKTLLYQTKMSQRHQRKVIDKLAERIESESLGWKAKPMDKWNGLSMLQVNSYAGIKREKRTSEMLRQHGAALKTLEGRVKRRSFLRSSSVSQLGAALPEALDWTNVNGRSYVEEVMDQSECGSCYVASAMRMLTARHKIKQNDTSLSPWSISFPLQCSEYNQGCKGGYGILATKWSQEVGLLPAECMQYGSEGACQLECNLKELKGPRFRADNHRYVGSWYGEHGDKVEEIKAELYHNGPLILGLEPSEDFMWYSEGIYRSPGTSNLIHPTSGSEWERVDHAVLLVGYGEENGQKYWKLQNSWGEDWGEKGYFRIVMGENDSGIESIPEAADVVEDEQRGRQVNAFFQQQPKGQSMEAKELRIAEKIEKMLEGKLCHGSTASRRPFPGDSWDKLRHAASVVGHGAQAQIAPVAASQVARVLQKHGERHKRRRALNEEAKQIAMAVDMSIWALGMICEHQERNVGGDSTSAWKMWLSHMPPRCDREVGIKACSQLLQLVVKNHPVVTATEQLPRVLAILADSYKSRNSNSALDKDIAAAVAKAGAGTVKQLASSLPERQQKKLEQMLKDESRTDGNGMAPS